jgi:hypothetical protein
VSTVDTTLPVLRDRAKPFMRAWTYATDCPFLPSVALPSSP